MSTLDRFYKKSTTNNSRMQSEIKQNDGLIITLREKPVNFEKLHNKIIFGDSKKVLKLFPSNCIDLIVTSPPYDTIRNYKGYAFTFDDFKQIVRELFRVMKKGGVIVWIIGDAVNNGSESGTSFRQALEFMNVGFTLHDTMIFEKNTASFPASRNSNRYTQIFEYMFVFSKSRPKIANLICDKPNKWAGHINWGKNTYRKQDGKLIKTSEIKPVPKFSSRNNIWKYVVGKNFNSADKESHEHPAIFPEKLAEDHIITWSNTDNIVLDPFMGSGTTCKMAKKRGRKFLGIEISEEYCKLAERIIEKY